MWTKACKRKMLEGKCEKKMLEGTCEEESVGMERREYEQHKKLWKRAAMEGGRCVEGKGEEMEEVKKDNEVEKANRRGGRGEDRG